MAISMKAARVNAGLTQTEAAAALHISKGTLAGYESGKNIPKVNVAQQIAELYKLSADDIIFFEK